MYTMEVNYKAIGKKIHKLKILYMRSAEFMKAAILCMHMQ